MPRRRSRAVTLYDAVAGRASAQGLITDRDRHKRQSRAPIGPDEVLGRKANAFKRGIPYEEKPGLPDSDLLKAVHQYAMDFYHRNGMDGVAAWAMEETALLAIGMLLEESVKSALGPNGDLAFVDESELEEIMCADFHDNDDDEGEDDDDKGQKNKGQKNPNGINAPAVHKDGDDDGAQVTQTSSQAASLPEPVSNSPSPSSPAKGADPQGSSKLKKRKPTKDAHQTPL
ncbi:hypothetical protein BDZ91DRAFT_729428 [Kalaharituber pfeilii]|nr:hypothetical protein BDZ91DRAFT_729428 [Kalaharituber pfeilii]